MKWQTHVPYGEQIWPRIHLVAVASVGSHDNAAWLKTIFALTSQAKRKSRVRLIATRQAMCTVRRASVTHGIRRRTAQSQLYQKWPLHAALRRRAAATERTHWCVSGKEISTKLACRQKEGFISGHDMAD
uniref:Uncharacterized protein n=1 Tax=Coccidioides posadasii RMSCC 3488 TaxID=454284 RepID=A0A0J6I4C1_COCPO|nr:hypothetical protein CPAG_02557 [Coccidioides posadasii RMSCC 3488]